MPHQRHVGAASPARGARIVTLDALRGVAILLVVAYHFSPLESARPLARAVWSTAKLGWIGVDLFFVLSGCLITGLLLDQAGRRDRIGGRMAHFYARRAFRILPAYYALLAILLGTHAVMAWMGRPTAAGDALAEAQPWYWTMTTNIAISLNGRWAAVAWAEHFWSLAVEEQFYLVWPLLALGLSRRAFTGVTIACIPIAFAARMLAIHEGGNLAAYVLTTARADAFAVGALVAIALRTPSWHRRANRIAVGAAIAAGLVAIGVLALRGPGALSPLMGSIGYSAWAALFGALVWLAVAPDADVSRAGRAGRIAASWQRTLRDQRALRWISTYSYGIYLVHVPVRTALLNAGVSARALTREWGWATGTVAWLACGLGLSLVLAMASWHWFEAPILRRGHRWLSRSAPAPEEQRAPRYDRAA